MVTFQYGTEQPGKYLTRNENFKRCAICQDGLADGNLIPGEASHLYTSQTKFDKAPKP